jgi:hypothetical protein
LWAEGSAAARMVAAFCAVHARAYLYETLAPLVQDLCSGEPVLEVGTHGADRVLCQAYAR